MSNIELKVSIPLDDEGYLRKECPFCLKQFKVLLTEEESTELTEKQIKSFMVTEDKLESDENTDFEPTCPYCGQKGPSESWWTQEQLEYLNIIAENMIADILNENLIKKLKGISGDFIKIEANKMEKKTAWIQPEKNDMTTFNLDCCNRKMKIEDNWNNTIHCFFCGFPHEK